jgi:endoglucanase
VNRFSWACLLLVGACGSNGTTWIGAQAGENLANPAADSGSEATAVCTPVGPGDVCSALPPRLLPALVVKGNQILQDGRPYRLYAMARSDLLWGELNWDGCNGDDHFHDGDLELMKSWNINAVRIGLSQARWFGRKCDIATYPIRIDHAVTMANAHGLYVILDLHWTDVGGRAPCDAGCATGLQPMPDAENVELWREVAARYGSNPGVVFDIFNEPGTSDWSCWRNGGCMVNAGTVSGVTYAAAGMQQLFDAARNAAPRTVVIVAGANLAEDLSGITDGYAITGEQIIYGAHVYRGLGGTASDWLARFGSLSATYPVMPTELGSFDCSGDQTSGLLAYLDAPLADPAIRIGWGIRSWDQPGNCGYPSIIADWNGTPLGAQGQAVHDHLRSYGAAAGAVP